MNEDVYRLRKLLEYWIEHNEDHSKRFSDAANDAKKKGLVMVANYIQNAALNMNEVTKSLREALESLE